MNKKEGKFQITVLISGSGTNLQAIIDAIEDNRLPAEINAVISNKKNAYGLTRAEQAGLPVIYHPYLAKKMSRHAYDLQLLEIIQGLQPATNLVVLAGWMYILGAGFLTVLETMKIPIINLHPALPGTFPGGTAIEDAFRAFSEDKSQNETGLMVHYVIPEIDAGEVIVQHSVTIFPDDNLDTLRKRIQYHEKPCLLTAIEKIIRKKMTLDNWTSAHEIVSLMTKPPYPCYQGKVRDVWDLGYGIMAMVHSNRFSSFDRHICYIPHKGKLLTEMSAWWFKQTERIVPNHYLWHSDHVMIVRKCQVIPIEVVVRAYITGSTSTSLWTHYSKGNHVYCGISFPSGLKKHQKLEHVVVTPTTKDVCDIPISREEIIEQGIVSEKDWSYIEQKALEIFEYGSQIARKQGYLLVDTKFEFGRDADGQIRLIDEVLTCDSSRYWIAKSYYERFTSGLEPDRLDKDIIREYVRANGDPYAGVIPEIPIDLKNRVVRAYSGFYRQLTGQECQLNENSAREQSTAQVQGLINYYFHRQHYLRVILITDSKENVLICGLARDLQAQLKKKGVYSDWKICDPAKNTVELLEYLVDLREMSETAGQKMIFICLSEDNSTLWEIVNGNVKWPVINCLAEKYDYPGGCVELVTKMLKLTKS